MKSLNDIAMSDRLNAKTLAPQGAGVPNLIPDSAMGKPSFAMTGNRTSIPKMFKHPDRNRIRITNRDGHTYVKRASISKLRAFAQSLS